MKKYIFLSLTILCLIFIYGNSLLGAQMSFMFSSFVETQVGMVAEVFNIRKLAHFGQFAVLGFFMTITTRLWLGNLKPRIFMLLFFGLAVAVSDEFLQLFSEGRSALVQDVVLDFFGFVSGMLFYIGIRRFSPHLKKLFPQKSNNAD